jgi:hypothetical protein
LGFVAAVHERANDFEVFHVLAGGEAGSSSGDEAALGIDNVGRQASAGNFLQTADQELQIDYRGDHAEKPVFVFHRIADYENGTRGFSFADHQSLAVVFAAVAGGGVGAFEFAVEKRVGSDPSCGDAFGVRVEKRGVGDLVGRGNEIFEQGAEFGGVDVGLANVAPAGNLDGVGQIGQHHVQRTLVLGKIVGERPSHGVLEQHLVALQTFPINSLHLSRVEIHRDDADDEEHTEDYIENRDAGVIRSAGGQVSPFTSRRRRRRSGGGFQRYLQNSIGEWVGMNEKVGSSALPKYSIEWRKGRGVWG